MDEIPELSLVNVAKVLAAVVASVLVSGAALCRGNFSSNQRTKCGRRMDKPISPKAMTAPKRRWSYSLQRLFAAVTLFAVAIACGRALVLLFVGADTAYYGAPSLRGDGLDGERCGRCDCRKGSNVGCFRSCGCAPVRRNPRSFVSIRRSLTPLS